MNQTFLNYIQNQFHVSNGRGRRQRENADLYSFFFANITLKYLFHNNLKACYFCNLLYILKLPVLFLKGRPLYLILYKMQLYPFK